jgi:hypothetical protein
MFVAFSSTSLSSRPRKPATWTEDIPRASAAIKKKRSVLCQGLPAFMPLLMTAAFSIVTPASPNVASAISLTIPGFKRLSNRGFVQLPKAGQDAADSERAGNRARRVGLLETDCLAGHIGFEPANPSAR